jgi:cyclopropane-fatty-acyl-phospholipid synthase
MKDTLHKLFQALSADFDEAPFTVEYWTGETAEYGRGQPAFRLCLRSQAAVRRILRDGALGFGEAYMDDEIEVEGDLQALLRFQNAPSFEPARLSAWEAARFLISTFLTRDTLAGARRNIARHYDLGNDFYRLWLDESMTYTCAYFRSPDDTLEQAQRNKHEHICRKLRLEPGHTLVDIGCGWGAMLFYAAENHGAVATGYTISQAQYDWVQAEIDRRGLRGRVTVRLQDYREAEGQFDRWVSIGMFEAVGRAYIPAYFESVKRLLKPGGTGLLHTIGSPRSLPNNPWVERYIFPGGYIPTLAETVAGMGKLDLNVHDLEDLRLHYGETLDEWHRRFSQHEAEVERRYGRRFVRMWRLYLVASAATFRHGTNRLFQIAFTNGLDNATPRTREYLYAEAVPAPAEAFRLPAYHPGWEATLRG